MRRYFFISLGLHLLVVFAYTAVTGFALPLNFSHGSALPRSTVLPASLHSSPSGTGILEKDSGTAFAGESIGIAELSNYANSDNLPPRYPPQALLQRWQGETLLLLQINRDGLLHGVSLLRSSGHVALDEAALAVARHWRFHGVNRPVEVRFPVRFVLD